MTLELVNEWEDVYVCITEHNARIRTSAMYIGYATGRVRVFGAYPYPDLDSTEGRVFKMEIGIQTEMPDICTNIVRDWKNLT